MILPKELREKVAALRSDNTAGATALAQLAGEIMAQAAETPAQMPAAEFRNRMIAVGKALIGAKPAMATIYSLVHHLLGALRESRDEQELRSNIRARAQRFSAQLVAASSAAARHAASLITDGFTVLTHSRSSLVEKAIAEAAQRGAKFSVICTESRPLMEGRALAERLAALGIPTTVVIDAAVASFVPRSNIVLVGADALSIHGLVNKIGTFLVTLSARNAGVPAYPVVTTHRFLPTDVPLLYQEIRNPQEIIGTRGNNLAAVNLYFDRTPLDHLVACVTENGILSRDALRETLRSWRLAETIDLEACG